MSCANAGRITRGERCQPQTEPHPFRAQVAIVFLMIYAWFAGRAAQLRGRQLLIITAAAAALGLMMIILKDVVLIHLH